MALNLLTPFTQVPRRSTAYDTTANGGIGLITGRWAVINSSGLATLPAAGVGGVYLVLEGSTQPDPTQTTTIGAGPGYLPAPLVSPVDRRGRPGRSRLRRLPFHGGHRGLRGCFARGRFRSPGRRRRPPRDPQRQQHPCCDRRVLHFHQPHRPRHWRVISPVTIPDRRSIQCPQAISTCSRTTRPRS
jgi:hypothetical protein